MGIPWAHSMPSREVNAATQLAEASWRRDKYKKKDHAVELCLGKSGFTSRAKTYQNDLRYPNHWEKFIRTVWKTLL